MGKIGRRIKKKSSVNNADLAAPPKALMTATGKRARTAAPPSAKRDEADTVDNLIERTHLKYPVNDFTLWEYNEKVIQYGYIMV